MQRHKERVSREEAAEMCRGLVGDLHRVADKIEGTDFLASVLVRAASGRVREAMERLRLAAPDTIYGVLEKERCQSPMGILADAAPFFETDSAITRKRRGRRKRTRKA